ncbi:MAG: TRAP transporter large permease subunit [Candidatus Methylomirabilota bacterium]
MNQEYLGILMLVTLLAVIFVGFPITFTLIVVAVGFGYFGLGQMVFDLMVIQTYGMMQEEVLAAVPLFVFMGYIVERADLMERLFRAFRYALAPIKGSLYLGVVFTATIFAMATGIVGAAVTVLGIMAAPIMMKCKYDPRMAAGAITAGGTLGILIPPSVMLVVMGPVMNVSVAKLYAACFGPGFLLASLYVLYLLIRCYINPELGPPLPKEERLGSFRLVLWELVVGMVPLGILIGGTMGTILIGLATPTEAAAMGAAGSLLLALGYRKLSFKMMYEAAYTTIQTSSMVLFLGVASNVFGAVFARLGSADLMTRTLLGMQFPPIVMLLVVMVLLFILGWPFEWPAIIYLFLPIVMPLIVALKYDLIWFGALVAVNLQTAFLSPPVAMSAYYLKAVVPEWELGTIYRGMADFMVLQVVALLLLMMFPEIALWFPRWLFN